MSWSPSGFSIIRSSSSRFAASGSGIAMRVPGRRLRRCLSRRAPSAVSRPAARMPAIPPAVESGICTSSSASASVGVLGALSACGVLPLAAALGVAAGAAALDVAGALGVAEALGVASGVAAAVGVAAGAPASALLLEDELDEGAGAAGTGSGAGVGVSVTLTFGTVRFQPGRSRLGLVRCWPSGWSVPVEALKMSRSRVPSP